MKAGSLMVAFQSAISAARNARRYALSPRKTGRVEMIGAGMRIGLFARVVSRSNGECFLTVQVLFSDRRLFMDWLSVLSARVERCAGFAIGDRFNFSFTAT